MSLKSAIVAIFVAGVNYLGFLALTTTADARFIWPTIFIPLIGGAYLLSLHCPRCGTPIYKRKATIFRLNVFVLGWLCSAPVFCMRIRVVLT